MRTIDADKFKEQVATMTIKENFPVKKANAMLELIDMQPTVNDVINIATLKTILKKTYLEVANEYDVSDLHHDSDKVACVASRFRSVVLDKIKI